MKGFEPSQVKGIGVDTTGSTPLPVDATGQARALYHQLYRLYRNLHDAFGTRQANGSLHEVMKELIRLRKQARK